MRRITLKVNSGSKLFDFLGKMRATAKTVDLDVLWNEQNFRLPLNLGMTDEEGDTIVNAIGRGMDRLSKKADRDN